jgi:MinD-like ATPase involved in chromosome partitioning or flagellar assembly
MAKIISIHSFRGGTGKSNIAANITTLLAAAGQRVAVIDTDIQSPGIHNLFNLEGTAMSYALNDYLWGRCSIQQAATDVTARLETPVAGQIFLIPSSVKSGEIARILREGCDARVLTAGLRKAITELELDTLVIDTHPGLNEETMLSIAVSHALLIIMRPDRQDYEGTGVTVEVAGALNVPRMALLVNKVPAGFDPDEVRERVTQTFNCEVAAVLPHSDEMMLLASAGIFVQRYPDHPVTASLKQVAAALMA